MQSKAKEKVNYIEQHRDKFEVAGIKVYKKSRVWELGIRLKNLMSITELRRIEAAIAKEYDLKEVRLIIIESQPGQEGQAPILSHWDELRALLINKNPALTGFLKESELEQSGHKLVVTVMTKEGADYLYAKKCDKTLEKYIKDYLNADVKVSIQYVNECLKKEEYFSGYLEEESRMVEAALKPQRQGKDGKDKGKPGEAKDSVIMGKAVYDSPVSISQIAEDSGRITIQGTIFNCEIKTLNNGKTIIIFNITDNTNSITAKIFVKEENGAEKLTEGIKNGKYVRIKGDVQYDTYIKEPVIFPINMMEVPKAVRTDNAPEKRIELHAHTGMSAMDAVCSATDLIKRAKAWGHKAIAITDHGVVQAFPEADEASRKHGVKVIYGVEGYFVNDGVPVVYGPRSHSLNDEFVVFDIETTGLSAINDRITEIGAVRFRNGSVEAVFSELINPEIPIPEFITKLTGITTEMVRDKDAICTVLPRFLEFAGDAPLVAHNAMFDWGFIRTKAAELDINLEKSVVDTLQLSRVLLPELKKHKLNLLCEHLGIRLDNHHRASDDAVATALVFGKFLEMLKEKAIDNLEQVNSISSGSFNMKNAEAHHIILLVKNMTGLKNLYKLISTSHLDYFYKKPRILKSVLLQYREGLLIGSACEAGEIYKSILNGMDQNSVLELAKFYDYLEIQPNGNNAFLIRNGRVAGNEVLNTINKRIVEIGEKQKKPVVATGDVHFLEPEDEVYRRIIMTGQGFTDADEQAPLYFKTTEEMLEDFSYLGKEKAHEVVVQAPEKILSMIEDIKPIPEETFPPKIEGAEDQIREMTMRKAHGLYGEELPEVVVKRLEKELNSIINNGYAVMYLIAQKLVAKSLSDGYLVGSRGSVGSSFVATMCDITEVNPLPPHYLCANCKHSHFFLDGSIDSGADLPDKDCPQCGSRMIKDGHDIPFEMFLGFDGDKEPDIDLNFAGEYQPEAHKYTEELFGKGYVYRAGTIGTIAEKTAYGFIKKYFDQKGIKINNAETNRLVLGCTGIKRTTGQHPGGVMIVPNYTEVYNFTPIQRPADDTTSSIITTHFDYHSISGRLLKLDILGHDVPSIIRMLEDITGFSVNSIHLDDARTMSLFTSTEALGISLEDIDCKVGSLGIPEFGTKFVRQMLMDTQPKTFAELVRISGLSHGTDVWLNNAQDLVRSGTATLKEVISTRDDIMLYLIYSGVKPKTAFKIAESVRKGKGLTPEFEEAMREQRIPEWYIASCKTVKYLFPKAHATAYVMMSFRIAYYKVYYPEAFYATFYTVKLEDFDADLLVKGKEAVKVKWIEIDRLGNNATTKEKNLMTLLEVVYEMYLRGIKLLPVDLYRSEAGRFLVTPDGILPPINALQGVGASAAQSIAAARGQAPFISIDDLRDRAKVSKTVIEIMKTHGTLSQLPENNQLSLFHIEAGLT